MKATLTLIAILIAAAVGKAIVSAYFEVKREVNVEESLATAEKQVKALVPKMVDDSTRLDGAKAGPGLRFTYHYTLVSHKASQIDSQAWRDKALPMVRRNMREADGMQRMFRLGTTVVFQYRGNDGVLVDEVVMTPREGLAK